MGVLRVGLKLFVGGKRFQRVGALDVGFGSRYLEFGGIVKFQQLT